ncbi:hypothetical protein C8Q74DRAFT_1368420 [Fomes fomentarius]|nr:hypothetical protein C8Q74DRAFT_1368420 [Fomes fomentarius]
MARFRCPSASTISSSGSFASTTTIKGTSSAAPPSRMPSIAQFQPKQAATSSIPPSTTIPPAATYPRKDKGKGKLRAHASSSFKFASSKSEAVRVAQKKAQMGEVKSKMDNIREFRRVFVGNLNAIVSEEQLREKFQVCGKIRQIIIRVSDGVAVPTANLPKPRYGKPYEGTHYATVEFWSTTAAFAALKMDGNIFLDRKIIVSVSPLQLPETIKALEDLLRAKEDKTYSLWQRRLAFQAMMNGVRTVTARLTYEATEIIPNPNDTANTANPVQGLVGLVKRTLLSPAAAKARMAQKHLQEHPFPQTTT